MTENRIVALCRMITWVVFLRMFWNFISSLRWREEDLFHFWRFSLLPFQSYWTWYDGKYYFYPTCMSYNLSSVSQNVLKFYQQLNGKERGGSLSFLVGTISNVFVMEIGWTDVGISYTSVYLNFFNFFTCLCKW